ncbi:MAG: exopolysaccharide biosynthesis protein [Beijerinckiaceae bacterium]|nr:exopolysaccharide biosynthesis protein [Beijerinckiaceae bacterium]
MPTADRTSNILERLTMSDSRERVTVAEIMLGLRGRAFALLLVLLGLPNCLPMPPPIALISGFLIGFVAIQLILGFQTPWLPRRVLALSVARDALEKTLKRAKPYVLAMERLSRPRLSIFESATILRLMGVLLLILSIAMIVAVPVIGQIPLGIAVCLIGLGLVEKDGFVVISGLLVGVIGVAISGSVVVAFVLGLLNVV